MHWSTMMTNYYHIVNDLQKESAYPGSNLFDKHITEMLEQVNYVIWEEIS